MIFHDVKMELFHLSGVRKGVILVLILFYMIGKDHVKIVTRHIPSLDKYHGLGRVSLCPMRVGEAYAEMCEESDVSIEQQKKQQMFFIQSGVMGNRFHFPPYLVQGNQYMPSCVSVRTACRSPFAYNAVHLTGDCSDWLCYR